jgi:hypothetical protein
VSLTDHGLSEDELRAAFETVGRIRIERHEMGEEKYGAGTFVDKDMLAAALDEIIDLLNYLEYQAVQIVLLQTRFKDLGIQEILGISRNVPKPGLERLGKSSVFQPYKKDDSK